MLDQLQLTKGEVWPEDIPYPYPYRGIPLHLEKMGTGKIFRLKLALGRIRARDLKGQQNLDSIAQSIGLTWEEVHEMGDQLTESAQPQSNHDLVRESLQREVVGEFIDVLYSMGKKGEDLKTLDTERLTYFETFKLKLIASPLSRTEEAKFWMERALPPTKSGFYSNDFVSLGNEIKPILLESLKKALISLQKDPRTLTELTTITVSTMFKSAVLTGDVQFVPVIQEFTKLDAPTIKSKAGYAVKELQTDRRNPSIPW